jgi:hypothetical protein
VETRVIPKSVMGIFRVLEMGFWLASQCGCLGVPYLCVLWIIWRAHNNCTFEGIENSPSELKLLLFHHKFDWMAALSSHSFSTTLDI